MVSLVNGILFAVISRVDIVDIDHRLKITAVQLLKPISWDKEVSKVLTVWDAFWVAKDVPEDLSVLDWSLIKVLSLWRNGARLKALEVSLFITNFSN